MSMPQPATLHVLYNDMTTEEFTVMPVIVSNEDLNMLPDVYYIDHQPGISHFRTDKNLVVSIPVEAVRKFQLGVLEK